MKNLPNLTLNILFGCFISSLIFSPLSTDALPFEARSIDGTGNNLINSDLGKAGGPMIRMTDTLGIPPRYIDGSIPDFDSMPNARVATNLIMNQEGNIFDKKKLSDQMLFWGQFLAHEISFTEGDESDPMPIMVPEGDPDFPEGEMIMMNRSLFIPGTGDSEANPRQPSNGQTSYIDASVVYGFDEDTADSLRTFVDGKFKTSEGNLMPRIEDDNFLAGDPRANENFALTALQTLFVREHNRLATIIKEARPEWTDEDLFQAARKIVGAEMQAITYNEYLPALRVELPTYNGYDDAVDPTGIAEVLTNVFRLGHTQTPIERLLAVPEGSREFVPLRETFFNSPEFTSVVMDKILYGAALVTAQRIDSRVNDSIRNIIIPLPVGQMLIDLAAIDIQRSRDRGLHNYNTTRAAFGLPKVSNFKQITEDTRTRRRIITMYGSVDNIDSFVGIMAEDHIPGKSIGESIHAMMKEQFERLRNGDRFFYKNDPAFQPGGALAEIGFDIEAIENRLYRDIIVDNTNISFLPPDIFHVFSEEIPFDTRSIDGTNNNLVNGDLGKAGGSMIRMTDTLSLPPRYIDGSIPDYGSMPNPRAATNLIMDQLDNIYDENQFSDQALFWGQFLAHEISFTEGDESDPMPIMVPEGDPDFPEGEMIMMNRSLFISGTGDSDANPRQPSNGQTSYIDASVVYSFDKDTADSLRTFVDGKLKTSEGNLMPRIEDDNFLAGDPRANENFALTALQTLFVREHNRLAEIFRELRPEWTDEKIYQAARKIVGAEMQAITFNEYLPVLGVELSPYNGYDETVDPNGIAEVLTNVFRLGHTQTPIERLLAVYNGSREFVPLRETFFNSPEFNSEVMDKIMYGATLVTAQKIDARVNDSIRNIIIPLPVGQMLIDLAAIDIQRSRDRGLHNYNTTREAFGLPKVSNFKQITEDTRTRRRIITMYGSVDNIDSFVGIMSEDHLPGKSIGESIHAMMKEQFERLRDGDRFFYKNDPALQEGGIMAELGFDIEAIENRSYADIILDNTNIEHLPEDMFHVFDEEKHQLDRTIRRLQIIIANEEDYDPEFIRILKRRLNRLLRERAEMD